MAQGHFPFKYEEEKMDSFFKIGYYLLRKSPLGQNADLRKKMISGLLIANCFSDYLEREILFEKAHRIL